MTNWILMLVIGIITIILGVFCLMNPFAASLGVNVFASFSFIFAGVATIVGAFMGEKTTGGRIWTVLLGILLLLMGIFLFRNPVGGIVSLAWAIAFMLIFAGVVKIFGGFKINDNGLKWLTVISGVISIILAFLVFRNPFPSLGILLGAELIVSGIAVSALAFARKKGGVAAV